MIIFHVPQPTQHFDIIETNQTSMVRRSFMSEFKHPFKRSFDSLEDLADSIKDFLGCPVTIEDANHRLLAYSSHEEETDPARIATIITRRVPENVINKLWKEGIIPKLMETDEVVNIPQIKEIGLGNRLAISIRKNQEVLGYIWVVVENKKITKDTFIHLKDAANSAVPLLRKLHMQRKKKIEDYQDFFWQLITGHFTAQEEIIRKFHQLNVSIPEQYTVIVFQFESDITKKVEEHISYLITTSQKIKHHFLVVMRNELILLASPVLNPSERQPLSEFIPFFISEMKNRFSIEGIKGGAGSIYQDLIKVEKCYQEALQVIELKDLYKEELANIFQFHQLGLFQFVKLLKNIRTDEHPAIKILEDYDKENKTNLLKTLEVFIQNDSNVSDTAKQLYIHTNTLGYRLKRITEIADFDLKNVHEKMAIYLDLKIRKLKN